MPNISPVPAHWQTIGLMRFLLAMVVVSAHLGYVGVRDNSWIHSIYSFGSAEAVIAFFIISGYSIAHSISIQPTGYFKRRIFRIYPVYLTSLLMGIAPFYLLPQPLHIANGTMTLGPIELTLAYNLLLLQFWFGATIGLTGVAWSLSVEWFFYCLAPFLKKANLFFTFTLLLLSAVLWMIAPHLKKPWSTPEYWSLTHGLNIMLIGWAWLSGFFYYQIKPMSPKLAVLQFLLLVMITMYAGSHQVMIGGHIGMGMILLTIIIISMSTTIKLPKLLAQLFAYLADLSYPMYLIHLPVMIYFYNLYPSSNPWYYITAIAAGTLLVFHLVDSPCRWLQRRSIIRQNNRLYDMHPTR